jgi:hypothetical protein
MVKFSGLPEPLEPRALRERVLPFVILFAFALVLRLAAAWILAGPGAMPTAGAVPYDQAAWSLANDHGLAIGEGAAREPTALLPPLMPWLAHFAYRLFGREYFAALLLQAVLGALVPLLAARLGAPLFGGVVGFVAGIVIAADPVLLAADGVLQAEVALSAAILWAMIVSVEWVRGPTGRRAFWCGIAWGVAALAHPAALVLPFVTMAWAWVPLGLMLDAHTVRRHNIYVLAGLAAVIGPWMLRNAIVLGVIAPVTSGVPPMEGTGLARGLDVLLPWWAIVLPFALWGAVRVLRGARRMFQLFPLVAIGFLAGIAVVLWGALNARLPLEPLVVLFAAAGAEDAWRRWRTRRLRVVT